MRDLSRLINPKSIAVFGGGWAENVIQQLQKSGYDGDIWPVHPKRTEIGGLPCLADLKVLPAAPDAAFIGVNRDRTVGIVQDLSTRGAGGAICFASGFQEAGNASLQAALVEAAGDMPFLGPNCYGLINYLDNVTLWPDQHGGASVESGVAILAQSSNISINMTMQKRGLPIGHMITLGNQAQTGIAELIDAMVADRRVTAIGLYLEGFGDIGAFEAAALRARTAGKPLVVLKAGKSEKSQSAVMSHTASLTGSATVASAFLKRLGIVEVASIGVFLETLKILHRYGPLMGNRISSVSCSGGEASLMADMSENLSMTFPDFPAPTLAKLGEVLGPNVTLANPLDYHTYIWGDTAKMTACFSTVMESGLDLNVFVLDVPRRDRCDISSFEPTLEAIMAAHQATGAPTAVLSLLPENLDEAIIARLHEGGVLALNGMEVGLAAIDAACRSGRSLAQPIADPVWLSSAQGRRASHVLDEAEAKRVLATYGVQSPQNIRCETLEEIEAAAQSLSYPLALKTLGLAHKTEAGGVVLGIEDDKALSLACQSLAKSEAGYLIEEMADTPIAELIIGIMRDATGLLVLTLGAGGVLTELLTDSVSLALPATRADIRAGLESLKINTVLSGYRGKSAANIDAVLDAVEAVIAFAKDHKNTLLELDVNPLMVSADSTMAVDAFIRLRDIEETL